MSLPNSIWVHRLPRRSQYELGFDSRDERQGLQHAEVRTNVSCFHQETPNYPLSHTQSFISYRQSRRLLIRKAALSTTSLQGMGLRGKCQHQPQNRCTLSITLAGLPGCWKLRLHSAPGHKVLTQGPERRVCLGCHRCVGGPCPRGQPEPPVHLPHTQPAAPGNRGLVPQAECIWGWPAPLLPSSSSPSSPAKVATEHSTSKIPCGQKGPLEVAQSTLRLPIKTSLSRSCRRSRPESPLGDLKEWLPASFVATSLPFWTTALTPFDNPFLQTTLAHS